VIFFDSNGQAWTPCTGNDAGAEAFGPTGIARALMPAELAALRLDVGGTPWASAVRSGRLVEGPEEGGWDTLADDVGGALLEALEGADPLVADAVRRLATRGPTDRLIRAALDAGASADLVRLATGGPQ
jgi:hypothetical protein